jgi:cation transport regulator ChaC
LPGYKLCFHKRSSDESSKCNAFQTGSDSDVIWGVVFNIPPSEKQTLDRAEGLGKGYNEKIVDVITPSGDHVTAITYYADKTAIAEGLSPYSWYKELVLNGAMEHGLPPEYIASLIEAVTTIKDPDVSRDKRNRFN